MLPENHIGGSARDNSTDASAGREGNPTAALYPRRQRILELGETAMEQRPPLPPFTAQTAIEKVRKAEDAWNTRDPYRVSLAYTPDSRWRNRSEFAEGRDAIVELLTRKWQRELEYRLCKELWAFTDNRIGVRFVYESHDANGQWWRSFGNELWEFDENGLMRTRQASINDLKMEEAERKFRWELGVRPVDHPGLTEMGL